MVTKEIKVIVHRFLEELKKRQIPFQKVYLYGSHAHDRAHSDSDIDIAVICNHFAGDSVEQNMILWKIAVKIDPRLAPVSFSPREFQKDYIPIIPQIKKGLDLTPTAA